MAQTKYHTPAAPEKLELSGIEDEAGNPISALTILSLLERVAGIIDNVQAGQQRMEERQHELESNIKTIQEDVLKLAKDHTATSGTVEKLMQKARKVSANVKDVRTRVEKQNVRVKRVETTQDELLTRNRFRVVIYQGETEIPSLAVTKTPKGAGIAEANVDADTYDPPADLSSDEEYIVVDEADSSRVARLKKSGLKGIENIKATFSKENMAKTKDNLGTKFNHLGERIVPPEKREKMHQASARLKENIAKKAPTKETFRIKLKKERTLAEGQEGAEGTDTEPGEPAAATKKGSSDVTYTEVVTDTKREGPVSEEGTTRIGEETKIRYKVEAGEEEKGESAM